MNYVFIGGIVQFLTVINLAYAASLGYKESITNGHGIKKTSNGVLMMFFLVCATGGQLLYKTMRAISGSSKAKKDKDKIFVGVLSAILTYGLALFTSRIYNAICVPAPDGCSIVTKLLLMATSTLQSVVYYGFIFGLFGGENCRLVDTPISKLMSIISEKVAGLNTATFVESKDDVKELVVTEAEAQSSGKSGVKINPISYILSVLSKSISTVCESIGGITTILVDVSNFTGAVTMALFIFGMRAIVWFSNGMVSGDADVPAIVENPVDVLTESVLSMVVSIVVICLVKLIVRLIMMVLPKGVSDTWYKLNDSLYTKALNKLNDMSKENLKYDKYAMESSIRRMMEKASGDKH